MSNFKKYPAYKDSGVEWLGEIPQEWSFKRCRDAFKFSKGLTITKENLQDDGIPCVNYGEIHSRYGFELIPSRDPLRSVSEDYLDKSASSLLSQGDFIFADTSEDLEGSGNFTYLNSNERVFAGYHTVIARPCSDLHVRYIAYLLDSISYRLQIRKSVKGVKVFSITQSILKATQLLIPTQSEQVAIANFLDDKTGKIDQAIAQKEELIAQLKERKQIIIQNAVTKGLDPKVKMKDSGIEWLGEIPEHWEVSRSQNLFTQRKELARKGDQQLSATQAYGVILQKEYEKLVGRKVVKISMHLEKRKHVELNDFVISMRSFQGGLEVAWATGCIRSSYVVLKPSGKIDSSFYRYLLKTRRYIEALQSTANFIRDGQDLNFENFRQVSLPVIPLKEQQDIAIYLNQQMQKTDVAITQEQQAIEKLKEYKATLINSAVTGKIKVV